MDLAMLIHRIATDEQFATQFKNNPSDTLRKSGLNLDAESLQALIRITQKQASLNALFQDPDPVPDDPWNWAFYKLKAATA